MMKKQPTSLWLILLPVSLVMLLQGCGTKIIRGYPPSGPSSIRRIPPDRGVRVPIPDRGRIPPTQRPYTIAGKTYYPIPSAYGYEEIGIASWYGPNFHGKTTSCGETYNMLGLTAAHKILPMNTHILVKNLENGKEVVLRVNDRGPFAKDRIVDLSLGAARALGVDGPGTAQVKVTALGEVELEMANGQGEERFVRYQNFNEGEFYVQIGAFTNKRNADHLAGRMVVQGQKAVSQVYDHGDGCRYYRVQVWAGRTLDQAKTAEQSWEQRYPGAFVIAR